MDELRKTGEHLRTLRQAYGLTCKEIGDLFGYRNPATYNNWEHKGLNDLTKLGVIVHFYDGQGVKENATASIGRYVRYKLCQSEKTTEEEEQVIIRVVSALAPTIRKAHLEGQAQGDRVYLIFKTYLKQELYGQN